MFAAPCRETRHTRTHLDAVSVEGRSEEHVKEKELCGDVGEVEQLDEQVDDDQVAAAAVTAASTRARATPTSRAPRVIAHSAETAQVSTANKRLPCTSHQQRSHEFFPRRRAKLWRLGTEVPQ